MRDAIALYVYFRKTCRYPRLRAITRTVYCLL